MQLDLINAIASKHLVEFQYGGHKRVVEPHVLGVMNGGLQLLSYQVGGSSSSDSIPGWRRFDLSKATGLRVLDRTFRGARAAPSDMPSSWDLQIAVVAP